MIKLCKLMGHWRVISAVSITLVGPDMGLARHKRQALPIDKPLAPNTKDNPLFFHARLSR